MSKLPTILTLLSCWTLLWTAPATGAQTVRLYGSAAVAGGEVRLADVAETADLPDEAAQVVVARLPQPGAALRLRLAQVETELVGAGINVAQVRFSGAAWCDVRRSDGAPASMPADRLAAASLLALRPAAPAAITQETLPTSQPASRPADLTGAAGAAGVTISQHVQAAVMAQLGLTDARDLKLELDPRSQTLAQTAPAGSVTVSSTDRDPLGRRRWQADVLMAGQRPQRLYLYGRVSVRRQLLVTARDLAAGTVLAAADLAWAPRDDDGSGWLSNSVSAIGQQVRKDLRAGQGLAADDLEAPVLVRRGQPAVLLAESGTVQVRLNVRALTDGRLGESVPFQTDDSQAERLSAVVIGPGLARPNAAPKETRP